MTPEELQSALRTLLPDEYGVYEPYEDGTVEVGTQLEMPDGGLINVSVQADGDQFEVTEDGWHTSRWFLIYVGMDVPAETISRVGEVASAARVQRTGFELRISNLKLEEIPEAIDRMASTIRQIGDLVYAGQRSDLEATTAAAD